MMDGRVAAIRSALDADGYEHTPILSYAAKYASAFYGPFRDAAESTPSIRRPARLPDGPGRTSAKRCARSPGGPRGGRRHGDGQAGACPYLDVIRAARDAFDVPLWAYQVSGEFSMLQAAIERGWLDGERAIEESLTAIRRAGAQRVITYFAKEVAQRAHG